MYIVNYDSGAVLDLEQLKSKHERKTLFTAVDKLVQLGPQLVPPHMKSLKGEPGLLELRPRQGGSPARAVYAQEGDSYVILAIAVKTDKADFNKTVSNARKRMEARKP